MKRLIAVLPLLLVSLASAGAQRPNFVLLMGDDHGWSETGYNDHPHVKTPVLDEMAAAGLRLDRFYAGHPTCSPTRASVLTGRHPNRCGTFRPGWSIRPEEITVAHVLSQVGYRCGHFGKWHLGPVKAESPTNPRRMGFHEYVSHDNFYEMNPEFSRNGAPPVRIDGEGSKVTVDETLAFIERAVTASQPFLAVVWFASPHEPYSGLAEDLALYDDLPESYAQRTVRLTSMETGRPTTRPLRDVLRERYAEITAMDRAIGKLRARLDALGVRENTLLWYCGDNGNPPSSGRTATPLRGEKAMMYEGGIRVPGIMEWPTKIKAGRISRVNAVTSDMLPTLCELVGAPLPNRPLDGISLAPLMADQMVTRPSPIGFWQYRAERVTQHEPAAMPYIESALQQGTTPLVKLMAGKRTRSFQNYHQPPSEAADYAGPRVMLGNEYKLVIEGQSTGSIELFDLRTDSAEEKNVADVHPEIVNAMKERLRAWQTSVLKSLREADYP